jgi:hypothetical protein
LADIARDYQTYLDAGVKVAAVVIDKPAQNAAMVKKLALPFPILSDPDGSITMIPFDVWDSKGNMAKPATLSLGPDVTEHYRYVGTDFVDRPVQDDALAALAILDLPAIETPIARVPTTNAVEGQRASSVDYLEAYMRGIRSSHSALSERMRDDWDREELVRTMRMAERYIAKLAETKRVVANQG